MDFKGFQAGCSVEPIPTLSDIATQSDVEGQMEGKKLEESEVGFQTTLEMECIEEMKQAHHLQATDRKILTEISCCPLSEGIYSSSCLEKDAQRIAGVELKRIDPNLRTKRAEYGDEVDHHTGDGNPIVADMQIEQGCDTLQPSI